MANRFTEKEAIRVALDIVREMAEGTFVSNTDPINIAHEVDTLIANFGINNAAAVAAQMAQIARSDEDRVSDWKDVERVILKRQAEGAGG